jgi:hypothetical protein
MILAAMCGCAHRSWDDPGARWKRVTSEHFVVDTDASADEYQPVIERLEDVHRALSRTFFRGVQVPPVEVLLLERRRDFVALVGRDKAGVFMSGVGSTGVMVFAAEAETFDDVASIAAHELAHRFLHALAPRVPAWLDEGYAMYVDALELKDGLVAFDARSVSRGYVYFANPVPFRNLFAATELAYHSAAAHDYYMTSWMLVRHLFAETGAGAIERFHALVVATAAGHSPGEQAAAVSAALGGLPIDEIEAQIVSAHRRAFWGVAQQSSRRTLAVTLEPAPRSPLQSEPAHPSDIRALFHDVRLASGGVAPPLPPDPREACYVGREPGATDGDGASPLAYTDAEEIKGVFRSHVNEAVACLRASPPIHAGYVAVAATLGADGRATRAAVDRTTLNQAALEDCLGRAVCRWRFPRPPNSPPVVVRYHWDFDRHR